MELKINLEDYLTPEEIKEECKEAIRQCIYDTYRREDATQRLISNLTYDYVFKVVDECIGESAEELIKNKIPEIINELSSFSVFRKKDAWEHNNSKAYDILEKEMELAQPLIKKRVEDIINEYPFHELDKDEIGDVIHDCIMDRLFENHE